MQDATSRLQLSVSHNFPKVPEPMQKRIFSLILIAVLSSVSGCGREQKGGPREATYPITGIVTIDGSPTEQVQVICHSVGDSKVATGSAAYTQADGSFSIGTYESGDGAPAGEYKLTFKWGQINLMSGRYEGDKLNDRYSDPDASEFSVTVQDGKENDLGEIALTTK